MSHLIDALTAFIQNLYVITGLVGIVLAMAIESCCIPLPSEIIIPLAAAMLALSAQPGGKHLLGLNPSAPLWLNIILIAGAGCLGELIGSTIAYTIGYTGGRPLMLKYGKYVLISQHDADKADRFFQRWGAPTAFFSRLLPVVRTYISLPAGMTKMPLSKFLLYTLLGSLSWCSILAIVGYELGNSYSKISGPMHYFDGVVVVLIVVLAILYVWRHIRNDRRARAEHAAATLRDAQQTPANSWGQPPFEVQQPVNQVPARSPYPSQQWGGSPLPPQDNNQSQK